jgi:hypothetical protein
MYDKYLTGNTFSIGSTKLPKHKGFLIHNNSTSAAANGFTAYVVNDQGNTLSFNFPLAAGPNYFSNQFYAITAFTTGVTGIMMS